MSKRLAAGGLVALIALGATFFAAPSAGAHASLRSSSPASGAQVAKAPATVTLDFTEQPEPSLSSVRVVDASGVAFESGRAAPASGKPSTLTVPLEPLGNGVYTVVWRVLSRVDGHATAGSFAFGVGVSPAGSPPPPAVSAPENPSPSLLEMSGRLLLFAGFVAIIGAAWFVAFVLAGASPGRSDGDADPARRRLLGYASAGWALAAIGLPLLAEAQRRAADAGFGSLVATPLGKALVWRGIALLAAGAALAVAANAPRLRRGATVFAGVAAAGAALAHVNAGHASAVSSFAVASQWVHVVAISVWVGGLGALLAAVRGAPDGAKTRAIKRFSATAAVALAVVVATGVVRSLGEIDTLGDLFSSGYGRAILVKIVVLAILAALGAVNRLKTIRQTTRTLRPLRRVVKVEAFLAVAALGAAAVLAGLAPPKTSPKATAPSEPAAITLSGSDFATTIRARLTITPGFAGSNRFQARVTDYDSGRPVQADEVTLRFASIDDSTVPVSTLPLQSTAAGRYAAEGTNLSLDGRWRVTLTVQTGGTSAQIPFATATRCRVTATPAQGQPTIYDADLPDGRSVQMYAQQTGAVVEVHATYFGADGTETFVRSVGIFASRGDAAAIKLTHRRLSEGHFVADTDKLAPGRWRFAVGAATPDGAVKTCFEETVRKG